MVKLNTEQVLFIAKLRKARDEYDRALAQLEADYRLRREALKAPVSDLVMAALEAGVPARQVAVKGLAYADVGSLKQFTQARVTVPDSWDFPTRQTAKNARPQIQESITVEDDGINNIVVTDQFGERFEFGYLNGIPEVLYPDKPWYSYDGNKDEIRDAITAQYPTARIDD